MVQLMWANKSVSLSLYTKMFPKKQFWLSFDCCCHLFQNTVLNDLTMRNYGLRMKPYKQTKQQIKKLKSFEHLGLDKKNFFLFASR